MEIVDLYDENRNLLGRTRNRADKLADGEYIIVVGIWVFDSQNRILLTKRAPTKSYAPNLWENTGGHVQSGEPSKAAVVRELEEETGIVVTEDEIGYIGSIKVKPFFGDNYYVRKDFPAGAVRLQEGETCDAKWVTLEEFDAMAENGALAPSVVNHLRPIRDAFDKALLG